MLEPIRPEWSFRRPSATDDLAPTQRPSVRATPEREPHAPEWGTQRWKRQVEAEARHRLKRVIRDIGAGRN
jgi:hypothetical protein